MWKNILKLSVSFLKYALVCYSIKGGDCRGKSSFTKECREVTIISLVFYILCNRYMEWSTSILNNIKYFTLQFILFTIIIAVSFFADEYIGKPFTYVDLTAIFILVLIIIPSVNVYDKIKKHLRPVKLIYKISFSTIAVILATIFIGILTEEILL